MNTYQKIRESIYWIAASAVMLSLFYVVGCSEPKTTIGVGGGPTVAGTGGVGASLPPTGPSAAWYPPTTQPIGPQQCPILSPITGEIICSCSSLQAGEC